MASCVEWVTVTGCLWQLAPPPFCTNTFLCQPTQAWKPFGSSYSYAVKQLGVAEDKVLMVASHPWDVAGAMQVKPDCNALLLRPPKSPVEGDSGHCAPKVQGK